LCEEERIRYVIKQTIMIFKTITSNPILVAIVESFGIQTIRGKSRRDGILLTVGFNLRRTRSTLHSPLSPAGTTLWRDKVSSLQDFRNILSCPLRRLKPTVSSLRDFAANKLIQRFDKLILDILPLVLANEQKEKKLKNLIYAMSRIDKTIVNQGTNRNPKWIRNS